MAQLVGDRKGLLEAVASCAGTSAYATARSDTRREIAVSRKRLSKVADAVQELGATIDAASTARDQALALGRLQEQLSEFPTLMSELADKEASVRERDKQLRSEAAARVSGYALRSEALDSRRAAAESAVAAREVSKDDAAARADKAAQAKVVAEGAVVNIDASLAAALDDRKKWQREIDVAATTEAYRVELAEATEREAGRLAARLAGGADGALAHESYVATIEQQVQRTGDRLAAAQDTERSTNSRLTLLEARAADTKTACAQTVEAEAARVRACTLARARHMSRLVGDDGMMAAEPVSSGDLGYLCTLFQLRDPTDNTYVEALSHILGRSLLVRVCVSSSDVQALVARHPKKPLRIWSLDRMAAQTGARRSSPPPPPAPGVIDPKSLVTWDAKNRAIDCAMSRALEGYRIVDDATAAAGVLSADSSLTVVTRDGTVHRRGAISVSAGGRSLSNKMSLKVEADRSTLAMANAQTVLERAKEEAKALSGSALEEISGLRDTLAVHQRAVVSAKDLVDHAKASLASSSTGHESAAELSGRVLNALAARDAAAESLDALRLGIADANDRQIDAERQSEELLSDRALAIEAVAARVVEHSAAQADSAAAGEAYRAASTEAEGVARECADLDGEIASIENEETTTAELSAIRAARIELEVNSASARERIDKSRKDLTVLTRSGVAMSPTELEAKIGLQEGLEDKARAIESSITALERGMSTHDAVLEAANLEAFTQVRVSFESLSGTLLNKTANLAGDMDSGIAIEVREGEVVQALESLSGGQQAALCFSFLLALSKARPSPLIILDEADAALDEKKIRAVAEMLKGDLLGAQVLAVSHHQQVHSVANTTVALAMSDESTCLR